MAVVSGAVTPAEEKRARRKIRLAVEAKGYLLTELTWEPWGRAAEKEGIPGGWEGYVEPEPPGLYGCPAIMGLSLAEALDWIARWLPAREGVRP
jgi:hypothetical protein